MVISCDSYHWVVCLLRSFTTWVVSGIQRGYSFAKRWLVLIGKFIKLTCARRRDLSNHTRMRIIQRMNAAKNLCNVDPKILTKVNCSMTTHLLVLSSNPGILNRRGFTPVSTVLRKSVRKGDLQELKYDKFPGGGGVGGSLPPNTLRSLCL